MIKPFVFVFAALVPLMISSEVSAQQIQTQTNENILTPGGLSKTKIQELMDKISENPSTADDLILNNLLATPFEQRQYVFPAIAQSPGLSKKITSHPEIAAFKNKVPTKIPPQLHDFAANHLLYLSPKYFVFLDPALWQEKNLEEKNIAQTGLIKNDIALKLTPHIGEEYTFPNVKDLYRINPTTLQNYKKTNLTTADVKRVFSTIQGLKQLYAAQEDPIFFEHQIIGLMVRNDKIDVDLGDPFASLVNRLKMVLGSKETETFFKNQGWKGASDFAIKADRILKAARVSRLNPTMAIQFQKIRSYPKNTPNSMALTNLRMLAHMFEAPPGDVYFIEPFVAEIRKQLKPDFILLLGTPIYME